MRNTKRLFSFVVMMLLLCSCSMGVDARFDYYSKATLTLDAYDAEGMMILKAVEGDRLRLTVDDHGQCMGSVYAIYSEYPGWRTGRDRLPSLNDLLKKGRHTNTPDGMVITVPSTGTYYAFVSTGEIRKCESGPEPIHATFENIGSE